MKINVDEKRRRKRPKTIRLDGIEDNIRVANKFKRELRD
jgi:hypothetical protein